MSSKWNKRRWPMALRIARTRAGLTQEEVAEAIGVTAPTVSLHENGRHTPQPIQIANYAELYGIDDLESWHAMFEADSVGRAAAP